VDSPVPIHLCLLIGLQRELLYTLVYDLRRLCRDLRKWIQGLGTFTLTNRTTAQITIYSGLRFTMAPPGLRKVDFQVPTHLRLLIGLQRKLLYTLTWESSFPGPSTFMVANGTIARITIYSDLWFTTAPPGLRKVDSQVPTHLRLLIGLQRELLYTLIYDLRRLRRDLGKWIPGPNTFTLTNGTTARITIYSDLRFTTALPGLRKVVSQVPALLWLLMGLQHELLYTLIYDLRRLCQDLGKWIPRSRRFYAY
jgi:hypothetical protein